MNGPAWSEMEDALIAERYPVIGSELRMVGRTKLAIQKRANLLGVRRVRPVYTREADPMNAVMCAWRCATRNTTMRWAL